MGTQVDVELYGNGAPGGKASGLFTIQSTLDDSQTPFAMEVSVPSFSVVTTEFFLDFVHRNDLIRFSASDEPDDRIARAFMNGEISPMLSGDLWKYVMKAHSPVAVRSSSLLEDDLKTPLAGIYTTKMIPNNQPSDEMRFRKLIEAVKLVWASTYFSDSREFHRGMGTSPSDEAMAVILQEIVGRRYGSRFYPLLSGVARSLNFYAFGKNRPEEGVVSLALGLGRTIVDGGSCWSYSPARPGAPPPFGSTRDMMQNTQTDFWCVDMSPGTRYDPVKETEYMTQCPLQDADYDDTLRFAASTYVPESDTLVRGTGRKGPRVLDFAPVLKDGILPLNETVREVMKACSKEAGTPVELEFAVRGPKGGEGASLGLLQSRSMANLSEDTDMTALDGPGTRVFARSGRALGNGIRNLGCAVYVKPENFSASRTRVIAGEVARANRMMAEEGEEYLLVGFGRWGSTDPWLGIPVTWGHVSKAGAIVEISGPSMRVELSQGSHFFHNISSFGIGYLSVSEPVDGPVAWEAIETGCEVIHETEHVRCVRVPGGLKVGIDGRKGIGTVVRCPTE